MCTLIHYNFCLLKMSLLRFVYNVSRRIPFSKSILTYEHGLSRIRILSFNQERNFRKSYAQILKVMKKRRKIAGPDKVRKRNEWFDWNYDAELYAFNKRLHENITEDTLRTIFIHDSFVRLEEQKRKDMDVQGVPLDIKSNSHLAEQGEEIISNFIKRYLRHSFQYMPEEGISAVHDYLLSDDVLSHVSFNIGTKDLIFCAEYPPEKGTLATVLKAIVAGIVSDDSISRAETFVLDFICPQLIGKDIFEIWEFDKPLEILNLILKKQGRDTTESRLIFESGRNTLESVYHVGLYSDKEFVGRGVGETLNFAEEMAAYDALRRIFHLTDSKVVLPFGETAKRMELKSDKKNVTIDELCDNSLESLKLS